MFSRLKTIKEGEIYNICLKQDDVLMNCKVIENDTDKKLLYIEHLDNNISLSYSSIKDFNLYQ